MTRLAVFLFIVVVLAGCVTNPAYEEGRALFAAGNPEDGLARIEQAMRERPEDRDIRTYYFRQRDLMVSEAAATAETARRAGRLDEAEAAWRRLQRIDPASARARDGLAELAATRRQNAIVAEAEGLLKKGDEAAAEQRVRTVLAESPSHAGARALAAKLQELDARSRPALSGVKGPFAKPITLDFRDTPLKAVFEVISRTAGVNFVLDKDVKADTKVTIFVRNSSIDEVLRLIMATNQLQHKQLGETSVLVYPATAAKAKEYQETVTRSFYLANAEVKQAQSLLKSIVKSKDIFIDEKINLLVLRDTPDAVRLAERLLESLDLAEPEVMMEIEVLEIARSRLLELGLKFPEQVGYGQLQSQSKTTTIVNGVTQTVETPGGSVAAGMVDLRNTAGLTTFVANPVLLLNLKSQAGDGSLLANPRIRVKNREKAKVHIGDKLPVFTTTSTANVGVSASVSYLDIGLKLEVEPSVHLDDEVDIKVGLDVSNIVKEVPGPSGSLAYQVGNRSATTSLRLKHGETQVLAGLIADEERSAANRLPGLGDLPVIGRLFSTQRDTANKTEIVLLVTPRVLRNVARPSLSAPTVPAGTESNVGAAPLGIKGGRGISMSSRAGGGGAPTPAASATPVAAAAPATTEPATPPAKAAAGSPMPLPMEPVPPVPPPATDEPPAAPPPAHTATPAS